MEIFNKKFILFVACLEALIIGVCAVFFEPKINIPLQKMLGTWHASLTILVADGDDVLSAENKLAPMFEKRNLQYAVAIRNPDKITNEMAQNFADRGTELVYVSKHYGNNIADKVPPAEYKKLFVDTKNAFAAKGLKVGYVLYPYAWKAERAMKPIAKEEFVAAFYTRNLGDKWWKNQKQFINVKHSDRHMLSSTGYGFWTPITLEKLKETINVVRGANAWGIMVLPTKGKFMTPAAFEAIGQMLNYAKDNDVEIVTIQKGLENIQTKN